MRLTSLLPVLLQAALLLSPFAQAQTVRFDHFRYEGQAETQQAPKAGQYQNPVLAGFYPDPSLVRDGKDFYLVNSSFAYFPGIPIFHSTDLVHWTQLGSVLDRPSQLKLDGRQVSEGVFAPSIRVHDGTFYVVNTVIGGIGNFYVTARNPAGPWSEPVLLPGMEGIDPSFFFDDDGKAYIVHNGPAPGNKPLYDGHAALYLAPFDLPAGKVSGPERILVSGGTDISKHPRWIEGPHLFHHGGFYYLMAAEGGTEAGHSEVIFRAPTLAGPFVPYDRNPILTQRDLDPGRPNPIANTGHADLVEDGTGHWWAVFLGVEPYHADDFNTGRETFMLPVTWQGGWPVILPAGVSVPRLADGPKLAQAKDETKGLHGSFTWTDDFHGPTLRPEWEALRASAAGWSSLTAASGSLTIFPRADTLTGRGTPAFLGHRQQHAEFSASVTLHPGSAAAASGLALFQNEHAYYFVGLERAKDGQARVLLAQGMNAGAGPLESIVKTVPLAGVPPAIDFKIAGKGAAVSFFYRLGQGEWLPVLLDADATVLSTSKAGGFVGAFVGPYSHLLP